MAIDVEAFYRRYGPMVLRRCRQLLKDEDRALEATQDVFAELVRRQETLTGDAPSGLLLRMATNTCLNILRTQRRHPEDASDDVLDRIACSQDHEGSILAKIRLDRIFGRERQSTRLIAVLHYVDGLTLEEVAREVGLSVSGVRKRLRTLRARALELEGA
ncbi:MAG: sigma-70 family RNA polymerase sigma factor [Candidatus Eisenbacteria bacterium]|nr:sigma-70 family RNA polymerase sigma factor [Candidatus Eisenbacteria bacterium]